MIKDPVQRLAFHLGGITYLFVTGLIVFIYLIIKAKIG